MPATNLLFGGLVITILLGILGGIALEEYLLFGLPALYLGVYLMIVDFRKVFYLLLATIPLSTELILPNGLGMDFPSELIVIGLMGVYLLYLFKNGLTLDAHFFKHPITLLLLLHVVWIGIAALNAEEKVVAFKFLLAKIWYVVTYYFLTGLLIKT
ncbi:MAG: O-antigen ligase family protein, partial [Bacteroidota bacterium]